MPAGQTQFVRGENAGTGATMQRFCGLRELKGKAGTEGLWDPRRESRETVTSASLSKFGLKKKMVSRMMSDFVIVIP